MSDLQTPNVRCPGCGSLPVREGDVVILKHGKDLATGGECREKQNAEYKRDQERARAFLSDPKKYLTWITEEIAIHAIRVDRLALKGDMRAIKEFREAGMEISAALRMKEKADGSSKQGGSGAPVGDADRGSRGKPRAGGAPS